uniref:Fungal-type protein kinase domain-containing protein n=1 Tax=Ganoderma boninense TaxID=34458 RepID=A0A5K1K3I3_9APHY|nr:Uncharacterized protein [Ganoderma boninense]
MTVSAHRPSNTTPKMQDVQPHRVVFDDVGKPRRKYQGPEQLVRTMRMAFVSHNLSHDSAAHRDLRSGSPGMLQRDLSAGNILTYSTPSSEEGEFKEREAMDTKKIEGSLTDVEYATLPHPDLNSDSEGPKTAHCDELEMTTVSNCTLYTLLHVFDLPQQEPGAAAFMASSLLWGDLQGVKPGETVPSRTETPAADIESFAWVFVFVVYKHALENFKMEQDRKKKDLREEFDTLFPCPGSSAETVLHARYIMRLPGSNQHILRHIQSQAESPDPGHFCDLFSSILEEILAAQLPSVNTAKHSLLRTQIVKRVGLVPASQPLELVHDDILGFLEGYLGLVGKPLRKRSSHSAGM